MQIHFTTFQAVYVSPEVESAASRFAPCQIVVNGKKYNGTMVALNNLSDDEVANVVTYVRNSFGNSGAGVTVEEVRKIRAEAPPPTASQYE